MHQTTLHTKLLAWFLSLALLLAALPTGALAAGMPPPTPQPTLASDFFFPPYYYTMNFGYTASHWIEQIREIAVEEEPYQKANNIYSLRENTYVLRASDGQICLPGSLSGRLTCVIQADGYDDLTLELDTAQKTVQVGPSDEPAGPSSEEESPERQDDLTLHVRLVGSFEAALERQKGYDAVTGASVSVTTNKNSNAEIQCALLKGNADPEEGDWTPIHKSGIRVVPQETSVHITPEGSGMTGVYATYDSALTLAGTPETKGEYRISVTVTDDQGRRATSNELPFRVYSGEETLSEQLRLEHAVPAQDGKYLYDMEPWSIRRFGGTDERVTVPAELKAWFGSHVSGTYGKLGYALGGGEPVQTLLIPAGCDLTLVNMDVLSSVRIVVESGGRLRLRDSVVQGVIEVEDGGAFSMNYDDYHKKFLSGASINGQLRLKDGAVLEHAAIYSNTNFIADGTIARRNVQPVVAVQGNVTVQGQVFIRGDEAPSGTDPQTGISYAGQSGLSVTGGTLELEEGSLLAVYAGGTLATTSVGGVAIRLEQGSIAGTGTLLAVGGDGTFGSGGHAVDGAGRIDTGTAYLLGGSSAFPKDAGITGGKGAVDAVAALGAVTVPGKTYVRDHEKPQIPRWSGASTVPGPELVRALIAYAEAQAPTPETGLPEENAPREDRPAPETTRPDHPAREPASPNRRPARGTSGAVSQPAPTPAPRPAVADVPEDAYYHAAAQWAVELSLFDRCDTLRFCPGERVNRAQTLTAIWRAAGAPEPETRTGLSDVPSDPDVETAVLWALGRGIVVGTGGDLLQPDTPVTRAQAITFLYRAAGAPAVSPDLYFQDVDPQAYYASAVQWAWEQNISYGTGGACFRPEDLCDRAQLAALLYRAR